VVEDRLEEVTRADEISDQAAKLVASLPDPDDVQKICRYEAHLYRHLRQVLGILSRLQGTRFGTALNVDDIDLN
jgi:hypothetical protein